MTALTQKSEWFDLLHSFFSIPFFALPCTYQTLLLLFSRISFCKRFRWLNIQKRCFTYIFPTFPDPAQSPIQDSTMPDIIIIIANNFLHHLPPNPSSPPEPTISATLQGAQLTMLCHFLPLLLLLILNPMITSPSIRNLRRFKRVLMKRTSGVLSV